MSDKGFLFFHDWADPLRELSGDEFKEMFFAMYDFQVNDIPPPEFDGTLKIIGAFVFPQLDRRKASSYGGKKGMQKRWENSIPNKGLNNPPNKGLNNEPITQDKDKDKDKTKQDIDNTPSGGVGGEGFERFWSIYPKKTGRDAAREAYNTLSITDVDELIQLVERWKSSAEWKKESGRYIRQAEKFLTEIFPERINPPDYNEDADGFWNEAVEAGKRRNS